jgi:hypothetical protein
VRGSGDRPGERVRTAADADCHGRRHHPGAVAFGQLGQFATAIVCALGDDVEQAEHPDDDVGVHVYGLALLVAVGRGNAVALGQLAQVLGDRSCCGHFRASVVAPAGVLRREIGVRTALTYPGRAALHPSRFRHPGRQAPPTPRGRTPR